MVHSDRTAVVLLQKHFVSLSALWRIVLNADLSESNITEYQKFIQVFHVSFLRLISLEY